MPHYAHVLSLSRLEMMAHIGFFDKERNEKQPIEVSFRLYFPNAIASTQNDNAAFFNYATLAEVVRKFAESRKFKLIEFMATEIFRQLRTEIDKMGGQEVKLWLQLNKIKAPVLGLKDGASFTYSDLPPDATFIPSVLL